MAKLNMEIEKQLEFVDQCFDYISNEEITFDSLEEGYSFIVDVFNEDNLENKIDSINDFDSKIVEYITRSINEGFLYLEETE